ncbi:MAG: hypothetical protein RL238_2160 [Actinomycetota bacterium]
MRAVGLVGVLLVGGCSDSSVTAPSISVVSTLSGDVPCYSVVETSGAVVIPEVCPFVEVPSNVRFVAGASWGDGAVTLVYVSPGLAVSSSQTFSRDETFGWTAFVTDADGTARFRVDSRERTVDCVVTAPSVECG